MAGVLNLAAQRINASTAGLTGRASIPSQEPGAPQSATATELADLIPSEFGGLTHLFGGEAPPSTQHEPINPSVTIPAGSMRGRLGGLVPDFTNTATHAVQTGRADASKAVTPLSAATRNYVGRARRFLGL
jgi:hypothetical protein